MTKTVRATPAAAGHGPRMSDQLGGLINSKHTHNPGRDQELQFHPIAEHPTLIRAELSGDRRCSAGDIAAAGTTPALISTIKAHIAKGDKAADKAEQHYIAAGQHLKQLKAEHDGHDGTWAEWEELLKEKIGIGKSRASELMAIADGTKTVEEVRAGTAQRMKQLRSRSPSRDGENTDDPETSAETMKAEFAASDGKAAAPSPLPPPAAASESSWRVELTTDDGRRWINGARFKTKEEAALFAIRSAEEKLSPLWRPMLRKAGHKPWIIVMTRVLASGDVANCDMRLPEGRLGEANVYFRHGECHLLRWHPEDEAEPSRCALPAPAAGNGSDPEQSAAKRREEFAALEHGARDDGGDPGDIPACLRRRI